MSAPRLPREFFTRPTLEVAKDLLGKYLVHEEHGQRLCGMIVETEAYVGREDAASHSYGGRRTGRNEIEYGPGGHVYIYLVYGLHWQLNFVTSVANEPECVLIRALEPVEGVAKMKTYRHTDDPAKLTNGPGKLCQALHLNKSFNGYDLCDKKAKFFVEDRGIEVAAEAVKRGPRIGIDYAGPRWSKIDWRFWIKDNPYVSK
ncbi:MAG: DNA-3-methyladenine glycosylase [Candidatus Margulisiibacteriota bacterium]|jgi:DNA-3-methyladenine glycosylase